jgi:hypothetical protein
MYGSSRSSRQQLHGNDLQYREHRTNRGGFVYAGSGCGRQQLHGDHL